MRFFDDSILCIEFASGVDQVCGGETVVRITCKLDVMEVVAVELGKRAGGKDVEKIDEALSEAEKLITLALNS